MKCTKCGFDNFDNAKFCEDCGANISNFPLAVNLHFNVDGTISAHRNEIESKSDGWPPERDYSKFVSNYVSMFIVAIFITLIIIIASLFLDFINLIIMLFLGPLVGLGFFLYFPIKHTFYNFQDIKILNELTHNYRDDISPNEGTMLILIFPLVIWRKYQQLERHFTQNHPDLKPPPSPIIPLLALFVPNLPLLLTFDFEFFNFILLVLSLILFSSVQGKWQRTLNEHIRFHKGQFRKQQSA
ncbi:MAG: zinc ribbon domain-containing protein [Candidatus Heimdallarchaeota archaeon]|nr:zinc ribbon domain-containing protein [Candidatus Heimdallarchaeota archaeon]